MSCVIMDALVFLNLGVGFSSFHLSTKLHLVPKYCDLIIIGSIVPYMSSQKRRGRHQRTQRKCSFIHLPHLVTAY